MVPKSKTLFKPLREIFDSDAGDELNALLAMFCVLYQDLRLEIYGIATKRLEAIDDESLGEAYRQLYFVRRAAATQLELSGAIKRISADASFKALRRKAENFYGKSWKPWDDAVRFFQDPQHHDTLKKVRNDVGGHFSLEAAKAAVVSIRPDTIGTLEMMFPGDIVRYKLHFAGEIAGTATFRQLPGAEAHERATKLAHNVIMKGSEHATAAMYVLVENIILERFGFWSRRSRR